MSTFEGEPRKVQDWTKGAEEVLLKRGYRPATVIRSRWQNLEPKYKSIPLLVAEAEKIGVYALGVDYVHLERATQDPIRYYTPLGMISLLRETIVVLRNRPPKKRSNLPAYERAIVALEAELERMLAKRTGAE